MVNLNIFSYLLTPFAVSGSGFRFAALVTVLEKFPLQNYQRYVADIFMIVNKNTSPLMGVIAIAMLCR